MCTCSTKSSDYQPMPTRGSRLYRIVNVGFEEIAALLRKEHNGIAYCYIVRSVGTENGRMVQKGSGPNFQGDLVTLCTCKRRMRTYRSVDDWKGVWIIGISGSEAKANHAVFYMMKVLVAFESYRDLWYSDVLTPQAKVAKAAKTHPLGDIFEPKNDWGNPFDPTFYKQPIEEHSHARGSAPAEWHKDIDYYNPKIGHRAALLIGDPKLSFIRGEPRLLPRFGLGVGSKKINLDEFDRWFEGA